MEEVGRFTLRSDYFHLKYLSRSTALRWHGAGKGLVTGNLRRKGKDKRASNRSRRQSGEQRERIGTDRCRFTYVTRVEQAAHIHSPIKTYARLLTHLDAYTEIPWNFLTRIYACICVRNSRVRECVAVDASRSKVSAHVALSRLPFNGVSSPVPALPSCPTEAACRTHYSRWHNNNDKGRRRAAYARTRGR